MNPFIRDFLGPALKSANTRIYIFDHNKADPTARPPTMLTWAQLMYGDAQTKTYITGSAVHWYDTTFLSNEKGLDALHAIDPTKEILFDEGTADGLDFNV